MKGLNSADSGGQHLVYELFHVTLHAQAVAWTIAGLGVGGCATVPVNPGTLSTSNRSPQ